MVNLPEEILEDILLCLPPESLMRFKCVCKSWYALISSHEFTSKHLDKALQRRNSPNFSVNILFKRNIVSVFKIKEYLYSFLTYPEDGSNVDIDWPPSLDSLSVEIRGHCYGIFCLSDRYANAFLCNPATKEFRELPSSTSLPKPPPHGYDFYCVGFGYDPKSKNFKVVRVVFGCSSSEDESHVVEVYNLSTNCWREVITPVDIFLMEGPYSEMYHEGVYYWLVYEYYDGEEIILSFDMSKEVFHIIPVPTGFSGLSLGVLNRLIVLFNYPTFDDTGTLYIWMMEKDESWSMLLSIDHLPEIETPLMFLNSDELLMLAKDEHLMTYNLNTQKLKRLPIAINGKRESEIFQASAFVQSLLSVKGGSGTKLYLEKGM